jgi:hypothetical protein
VLAFVFLAAAGCPAAASNSFVAPTTTLAAQTSNNTSAARNFTSQTNGNRGAGSTSKVDIHSLLYSGATTRIYAHMVLWFGQSNHMNIGYSETNPAQVQHQIDDMVSRGINGVIVDWYGPGNAIDHATKLVMAAAESHPGFTFALMIDQGAIEWYSCPGCSPQQALINDLQYIERTYFPSPAYLSIGGQPVVTNFNVSLSYPSIDWAAAEVALGMQTSFIFQNNSGFSQVPSAGSYSWVMPTTTDYGMDYLESFYQAGETFPAEKTMGATYKGFNDTLAAWGSNRIMGQQCGQTWLQTFSKINSIYNSENPLPDLQLVTWNDYEEATEIESGIDNCLTVSAAVAANSLRWTVRGNENTVDHYAIYISADGQELMPLTEISSGDSSLNLCSFSIPNGSYQIFVQAIGRPTLANQMSAAVPYNSSCDPPAPTPKVSLSASPNSVTISAGQPGTFHVMATPQSGTFNGSISLACGPVPNNLSCAFYPAIITPGGGGANSSLTVRVITVASGMNPSGRPGSLPIRTAWVLPIAIAGFAFLNKGQRAGALQGIALCSVICLGVCGTSCGGTAEPKPAVAPAPVSYAISVNGSSSAGQLSTTVNVIVE